MKTRLTAAILSLILCNLPLQAGVVYDFTTHLEAPRSKEDVTGRVWVEGDAFRAEVNRGAATTVLISKDADQSAVILDPQKMTWANRSRVKGDVRSAALFVWPVDRGKVRGRPKVEYHRGETEMVAGYLATSHSITCAFDVAGGDVKGHYAVIAKVWTTDSLSPLPMRRDLRTGYEPVDRQLGAIEKNIGGMVLRHELEVVRTLDGGPAQIERAVTVVRNVEVVSVPPSQFSVPPAFRYAGPATPGQ